jgi:hypothetical protein
LKQTILTEEARPRDNANELSLMEALYDNAVESESPESVMPPPPSPPPPLPPLPQDAALPRAVRRLVMMENQPTADSHPPLIEESFPDLAQNEESPPSTFPDRSADGCATCMLQTRPTGHRHRSRPTGRRPSRRTGHGIQRLLPPRARMTTFQTRSRTQSAPTTSGRERLLPTSFATGNLCTTRRTRAGCR